VLVTQAERDAFTKRGVSRWFRETGSDTEGADRDPFEPVAGWRGYYRVRSRSDGACGFLSSADRCRIHEELGAAAKPLTCRMFPFKFHRVSGGAIVTASFGCPTIVANRGELVSSDAGRRSLQDTYADVAAFRRPISEAQRQFVAGRSIDAASIRIIRDSLLRMLARAEHGAIDLRANLQQIARALDDLTRRRVLRLTDADFAEYIRLTLPHAANQPASAKLTSEGGPGRIGRLMQFGFLYVVSVTRYGIEHRARSVWWRRLAAVRMLAHFHRLAPAMDRVNVRALKRQRVDINTPEVQPVAYHYLRASIEALGARERPILDDLAIAVSCLNVACALAVMNARASGHPIGRESFSEALMESVDVLQADERGLLGWALPRLAAGVEALKVLSAPTPNHVRN
jgi:Fe-S-cluster containining protein